MITFASRGASLLKILHEFDEIAQAQSQFEDRFRSAGEQRNVKVGHRGQNHEMEVSWLQPEGIWVGSRTPRIPKQQENRAREKAATVPVLMLLRQKGSEDKGWRGLPFWWPVIVVSRDAVTSVFAAEAPAEGPDSGSPYG
jgi:hypothetical protein